MTEANLNPRSEAEAKSSHFAKETSQLREADREAKLEAAREAKPEHDREAKSASRSETSFADAKFPPRSAKLGHTMTAGEAAKLFGVSLSTVQRACKLWEANPDANPRPGIAFVWTSPNLGRTDVSGYPMRGRRRLDPASVRAYGIANGWLEDPSE
jgi:hypothetical protein